MRFDHTDLVIRQRSTTELLDMTLRVAQRYGRQLFLYGVIGVVPFALLNYFLIGWMVSSDGLLAAEMIEYSVGLVRLRHLVLHAILVFMEAPMAGLLATSFLGQVTFKQQLSIKEMLKGIRSVLLPAFLILGLLRLGLVAPFILIFIYGSTEYSPLVELFLMMVCVLGLSLAVRGFRPFAPEILCLERCPLSSKNPRVISYWKRSSWLHSPVAAECIGRMFVSMFLMFSGATCLFLAWTFLQGVFFSVWQWNSWIDFVILPVALWGLVGYSTIYRFLCYLDTRIALEGWEVELLLKAEAERLAASEMRGAVA